jgi:hypothetical protein
MKLIVILENKGKEYKYSTELEKSISEYYSADIGEEVEHLGIKAFSEAFQEEVFGLSTKTAVEVEVENDENIEEFDHE